MSKRLLTGMTQEQLAEKVEEQAHRGLAPLLFSQDSFSQRENSSVETAPLSQSSFFFLASSLHA